VVIYNGYDARKSALAKKDMQPATDRFRIKYVGNVTGGQKLAESLALIRSAFPEGGYELSFVGSRLSPDQLRILAEEIPGSYIYKGFMPHERALAEMADCELLLLLINYYEGFEGMLTTKLFEYIASETKIFCISPHGGEAEELITKYQAGACFNIDEKGAAAEFLSSLYASWKNGENLRNKADTSDLSAQEQAGKLISWLKGEKKG